MGIILDEIDILLSKKDEYFNFDNWTKILFVVGIAGSGKTTLGKKLAEDNNCKYLELESLFKSTFIQIYGEDLYKLYQRRDDSHDESTYKKIGIITFNKMEKIISLIDIKCIIEGLGVPYLNFDIITKPGNSILLKNTSVLHSFYRLIMREKSKPSFYYKILNVQMSERKFINIFVEKIRNYYNK